MWLCQCSCGNMLTTGSARLQRGHTRSCGCLQSERTTEANIRRGSAEGLVRRNSRPAAYSSWHNMRRRCTKIQDPRYPDWGGRGVAIDPRWLKFANFYADMGERPPGMTLDRIDNDGPYTKSNCKWSTPHEQQVNNRLFKLVPDVVEEIKRLRAAGLSMSAIGERVSLHRQTVSRALSGKTRQRSKN